MPERPEYDFDEIQKAMEDTEREAFDYFLDRKTGEVIVLSGEIIEQARRILDEAYDEDVDNYEDVEVDQVPEVPDWAEDEVELALDIYLHDQQRYARIPERSPEQAYAAMKEFSSTVQDEELRLHLQQSLDGKGAFRKFKDLLGPYPKERKMWYVFNAKASRQEIAQWLAELGSATMETDDDTAAD
ncbi:MAG: hypothetical protein OHK006_24790 [Thermodesulfovibrionales bacterium]